MQDVFYIESVEQAVSLLKPIRLEILQLLDKPRTCPELGEALGETAQKIYYHVKALEHAGLIVKTAEKQVRGATEGYYQARARSYWLAPQLVGQVGSSRSAQDQTSLRVLLSLTEEIQSDVGHLAQKTEMGQEIASLSLSAYIQLPDVNRRIEFLQEVQTVFQQLAIKYGDQTENTAGDHFRLVLVCYPKDTES